MSLRLRTRQLAARAVAVMGLALAATGAHAGLYTTTFGDLVPGYSANDDETFAVSLPFSFTFFGSSYTSAIVSNNGNVQFGTNSGAYTSSPLNTQTSFRGIAAFWSDLESRSDPLGAIVAGTGGAGVYVNATSANQIVFTWDRLGYYNQNYSARTQFQLVLNNPAAVPVGEGSIGFFYSGMGGVGGLNAAIGFGDGLAAINDGEVSVSSGTSAAAAAEAARLGNVWFNVNDAGTPTPTGLPEPASMALVGAALCTLALARRRRSN